MKKKHYYHHPAGGELKSERKVMIEMLMESGVESLCPLINEVNGVMTIGTILPDGEVSIIQTCGGYIERVYNV